MTKLSPCEESGRIVLEIFRCNGIQPGGKMLFPAISAQFMQVGWPKPPAPAIPDLHRPGDHHWSHMHTQLPGWQGPDLSAGISYLLIRGYLQQASENRTAYFLTDAGFEASGKQE